MTLPLNKDISISLCKKIAGAFLVIFFFLSLIQKENLKKGGIAVDDLVTLISNVGFPIAVATYLLVRLEPAIKGLQKSISGLTVVIARMNGIKQEHVERIVDIYGDEGSNAR